MSTISLTIALLKKKKRRSSAGFEIRQKSVKKYFNVPKNEAKMTNVYPKIECSKVEDKSTTAEQHLPQCYKSVQIKMNLPPSTKK